MRLPIHILALAAALLGGCGGKEGLTLTAQSPLAVGALDQVVVERCLAHLLIGPLSGSFHPCSEYELLTDVTLTADSSSFSVSPGDSRPNTRRFFQVRALAAGTARLTAAATTASGEQLTQTIEVEARLPDPFRLACRFGESFRCLPELSWLPGRVVHVTSTPLKDATGTWLLGQVEYRATGSLTLSGNPSDLRVTATTPGEGRFEPVSEALRAVTEPMVVQVASTDDVVSFQLATALEAENGATLLPPPLLPSTITLGRRADGGVLPTTRVLHPLLGLADGGWARATPETVQYEHLDGGSDGLCYQESCSLLDRLGTHTVSVEVPPRKLTVQFAAE